MTLSNLPGGTASSSRAKDAAAFLLFVAAYVLIGRAGLRFAYYQENATLIWAPSGLAVAAVWYRGARAVPAVWLGALLTNLSIGSSLPLSALIGVGNAAEAYVAYLAISRAGLGGGIHRMRDVARFFLLIVLGATTLAAANGVLALLWLGGLPVARALPTGIIWWLGDAGGVLVVAPLILAFRQPAVHEARRAEGALIALVVLLSAGLAFGGLLPGAWTHLPVALLPFPALAWAAARFGMRGSTVATAATTAAAVLGTELHTGPFDYGNVHVDLAMLWLFMLSMAASSMLIASSVEERIVEARARRDGEQWLALALEAGNAMAFELKLGTDTPPRTGIHGDDRAAVEASMTACAKPGNDTWECEYRATDGASERWIRERARIVSRTADGAPRRAVGLKSDMTERRRAEEERHTLERELQHSKRLGELGMLAGGVAHDFNNLLTVIRANTELARDKVDLDESLDAIDEATSRAADLTEQLLAYAGRKPLRRRHLDLGQLAVETVRLLESSVPAQVSVRCDVEPTTPLVEGDPSQLRQVLMNLLWNAGEAIGDRPGSVVVSVRLAPEKDVVLLRIEDDGAGMDEATKARVFEPFFSTKVGGRGLGMAAVLGIVRSHGGHIDVESSPGKGSAFVVRFPATDRLPSLAAPPATEARAPRKKGAKERPRVLVVDDEKAIRSVAVMLLQELGYDAVSAGSGREAVTRFEQEGPFDVAVLDMTMPGETGLQVLDALRAKKPGLPIVLMSGYSEALLRAPAPEGVPFLQKPFHDAELAARIDEALAGRRP